MFRSTSRPRDFHVPTHRETADEWGGRIAVPRAVPPDWFLLLGRMSSDGYLCHLDLNYHLDREFTAIVQTSRPVPEHFRVKSHTTPRTQLATYLTNSDRLPYRAAIAPLATTTSRGEVHLDGTPVPVEIHHAHDCRSAAIPHVPGQPGYLIVTAPDEHWTAVTDLVLQTPDAF
ncbi:hypothetical protein ACPC54_31755 [Kitasatospora sp. NPDC094028]